MSGTDEFAADPRTPAMKAPAPGAPATIDRPPAELVDLLHEVDAAIAGTKVPGVQYQAGIMDGSVYLYAMAFPLTADAGAIGFRGRYYYHRRDACPISQTLYLAAVEAFEDMVGHHFRFNGHRPHARVG